MHRHRSNILQHYKNSQILMFSITMVICLHSFLSLMVPNEMNSLNGKSLEAISMQHGRDVYVKALGKPRGNVWDCLLNIPLGQHGRDSQEKN